MKIKTNLLFISLCLVLLGGRAHSEYRDLSMGNDDLTECVVTLDNIFPSRYKVKKVSTNDKAYPFHLIFLTRFCFDFLTLNADIKIPTLKELVKLRYSSSFNYLAFIAHQNTDYQNYSINIILDMTLESIREQLLAAPRAIEKEILIDIASRRPSITQPSPQDTHVGLENDLNLKISSIRRDTFKETIIHELVHLGINAHRLRSMDLEEMTETQIIQITIIEELRARYWSWVYAQFSTHQTWPEKSKMTFYLKSEFRNIILTLPPQIKDQLESGHLKSLKDRVRRNPGWLEKQVYLF